MRSGVPVWFFVSACVDFLWCPCGFFSCRNTAGSVAYMIFHVLYDYSTGGVVLFIVSQSSVCSIDDLQLLWYTFSMHFIFSDSVPALHACEAAATLCLHNPSIQHSSGTIEQQNTKHHHQCKNNLKGTLTGAAKAPCLPANPTECKLLRTECVQHFGHKHNPSGHEHNVVFLGNALKQHNTC